LDAIVNKKLPTPISAYTLKNEPTVADDEEEDLPPRRRAVKRVIGDLPASEYDEPAAKVAVVVETAIAKPTMIASGADMPSYKSLSMKWEKVDETLLVHTSPSLPGSTLIASFDMDSTLVVPKSGAKFPKNRGDWVWMWPEIPSELKRLHKAGYKIVIFSNQAGISKGNQKAEDLTGKITDLCADIDVPIQAFLATANDKYRKPSSEMWRVFVESYNGGVAVNMSESYYIGDAAGRNVNWAPKKPKDHSVVDRKFAVNSKLPFKTPEEFFRGEAAVPFMWRTLDPNELLGQFTGTKKDAKIAAKEAALDTLLASLGKRQELIIMIGYPASGKSTFSERFLVPKGYTRVNRDILGTPAKCLSATKAALAAGKSVVVDNTNPSAAARAEFTALAKASKIPFRAFHIDVDLLLADHLNLVRELQTGVKRVPDIAYNMFRSKFQEPDASEGFEQIVKVPWIPKFDSEKDKAIFIQWTE
jgi:bifunctional polynucleotide phosphatase/kinase